MRILVTGGLGYIGSRVTRLLLDLDCTVTVLDNYLSKPSTALLHDIWAARIIRGDIRNIDTVKRAVYGQDLIIHLAAIVGAPACDLDEGFSHAVNVDGTENIVYAMDAGQRIIFTSTTSAYGKQTERVTEATPLAPLTAYGHHKAHCEDIITAFSPKYIIFRPATAFGNTKQVRIDLLPNTLAYRAIKDKYIDVFEPWSIRIFIHADDFAQALVYAAYGGVPWNEVYNLGDPKLTMTKEDLSRRIAALAGAQVEIVPGEDPDKRDYDVSFDKMWSTGIRPVHTLEDGFNEVRNNFEYIYQNYNQCNVPHKVQEFLRNGSI